MSGSLEKGRDSVRSLERAHVTLTELCLGPGRRESLRVIWAPVTAHKVWSLLFGEWETVFHYASGSSSIKVVVTLLGTFSCKHGSSHNRTQTYFFCSEKKKQTHSVNVLKGDCSLEGNRDGERENELSFI